MTKRILISSLIGTSVEFYDFYIYATAASLIFGPLFFPASVPSAELLGAYASFGIAFLARPMGGAVFGHFGDRIGRKATLVASLLLMGASTASIGMLPTYALAGWLAPVLLCMLRFGQGLALGGEWTGAVLLALENAPPGWKARFAMFAPLGAPIGFLLANGLFLVLTVSLNPEQFSDWGWRVPFLASAPLVAMGLWVRFNLVETPEFAAAIAEAKPARVPLVEVARQHFTQVAIGSLGVVACFSLYYVVTAFALGYGTSALGLGRADFLVLELGAIVFMAISIVTACWLADRVDPERILIIGCIGTIISSIILAPMLGSGSMLLIFIYLSFSLFVMGFVNGPLGAWLPSLFPPRVRYSGTSLAFNVGGIIGGAFSPIMAQALANRSGLVAVGFYLAITAGLSLIGFDASARRRAVSALERSERRYRAIFEQNHVSLCELDLAELREYLDELMDQGVVDLSDYAVRHKSFYADCARMIRFADVNDATIELLGSTTRDRVLAPIAQFLPPGSDLLPYLVLATKTGQERFEREARLLRADGKEVIVLFILAFPYDRQAFDRVACAMIDVTEREKAKEALQTAQGELARAGRAAAIGAISASIAHEVNQPIGAVVMFAQACIRWLQATPPDMTAASTAAERVVQHSLRASQIIQRTREQLKGQKREPEITDLKEVISDVANLLERELLAASARLTVDAERSSRLVLADRIEIQQVLANLITNGLHAMASTEPAAREITISVEDVEEDFISISVRDHGTGIASQDLAKLFDPFFTTKAEGMGMGLAICKTIVEAHGGTLTAYSHEGGGAVFMMNLPASTP
ncbi:MFS transporter [Rhizobium sp. CNPSo 4039]|uniref:MFS transporter n=1 Tax=Rhizobium sp. CNPSo 4039 TaxID=3021409 RepID=UPI00254D8705|nr:MFS transporter [Rhizobium sp. CNPSo 4039]MDK4716050.1 MFS transporter [Rhizobium sp. CNPSo 4039]